jgi:GDP-D-mannose 3',5'-epimerase
VITALLTGQRTIEIWGDGEQTRSFMYIDDCIHGTQMLMASDVSEPINLGSAELVTINQLVDAIEHIAGVKLERHYRPDAAVGVRGRSSDNTLIRQKLGWAPSIPLEEGIEKTYRWIYDQLSKRASDRPTAYC